MSSTLVLSEAQLIIWSHRQRVILVFKGLAAADWKLSATHTAVVAVSKSHVTLTHISPRRYYKNLKGKFDLFSAELTLLHFCNCPVRLF